eukprot:1265209-Amphidinium_carterae.3
MTTLSRQHKISPTKKLVSSSRPTHLNHVPPTFSCSGWRSWHVVIAIALCSGLEASRRWHYRLRIGRKKQLRSEVVHRLCELQGLG